MAQAAACWPDGTNYLGNEVRSPVASPREYVTKIALPRHRAEIVAHRVAGSQEMPEWARASSYWAMPGVEVDVQAGRVRLEYTQAGRSLHEDFHVLLPHLTYQGVTYWGVESFSSARAAKGPGHPLAALHQTMVGSIRLNLAWFNQVRQVAQMIQADFNRQQRAVMELAEYVRRANDEISTLIRQEYRERQAIQDRLHTRFSQYVRGVEEFAHPFSDTPVELPSGYRQAWANAAGEYILTDDLNFNPYSHFPGDWRLLEPTS